MHDVLLVVYPGFELLDASGPIAVFNGANRILAQSGRPATYGIGLVSATGGPIASSSGVTVDTRNLDALSGQPVGTLLVAGSEREHLLQALEDHVLRERLPPLVRRAERFGSVCSGVFLLAALGLLGEQRVTTHWDACSALAEAFPSIRVDPDALYVVDDRIWTSAGVTTGIDMALAMVALDLGPTIAGEVAKRLVLYARRPGYQTQFSPLLQAQSKGDSPFAELIGWIQANLDSRLDVRVLADRAGMTERTFHRRFLAATGESPARFVETVRLDAARMLLSRGLPLKVIAAQIGLMPTPRFREAFERRFGVQPRLYQELHRTIGDQAGSMPPVREGAAGRPRLREK